MRLEVARSFRRVLDQKRYGRINAAMDLLPAERRQRARALQQAEVPGVHIHCAFCGADKPVLDGPCPNDGPDWPHPKANNFSATREQV